MLHVVGRPELLCPFEIAAIEQGFERLDDNCFVAGFVEDDSMFALRRGST